MDKLWDKLIGFLGTFDSRQIRYLGDQLVTIVDAVATIAYQSRQVRLPSNERRIMTNNI
jgi:COP9 signalosome complex subunit 3